MPTFLERVKAFRNPQAPIAAPKVEPIQQADLQICQTIYDHVIKKCEELREDEAPNANKFTSLLMQVKHDFVSKTKERIDSLKKLAPEKRDPAELIQVIQNSQFGGLVNYATGLGGVSDPDSSFNRFDIPYLTYQVLDIYFRTSWIADRGISIIPDDVCGKWRKFDHEEPDVVEARSQAEIDFDIDMVVHDAMMWARLYGGAGIVFSVKGEVEQDFSKPLRLSQIKKGSLEFFNVVIKDQSNPASALELDPFKATYLKPEQYFIATTWGASTVHSSRIIVFYGKKLPIYSALKQLMWGDSKIAPILTLIDIVEALWCNVGGLVQKANIDVIQLKGYLQTLSSTPDQIFDRLNLSKSILSNYNKLLLDIEDKYERKELSNTQGLSEIMLSFLQMLAGAFGIPLTRFLGTSVGGFSSGENELDQYADTIDEERGKIRSQLRRIDRIMEMHLFGEVKNIKYEFDPFQQESAEEKSVRTARDADRDIKYMDAGVISEFDVGSKIVDVYETLTPEKLSALNDVPEKDMGFGDIGEDNPFDNPIQKDGKKEVSDKAHEKE